MSKVNITYGEECNICNKFMEFYHGMRCCQCDGYVCSSCSDICDGCGKYYTCKGNCTEKSIKEINQLTEDEKYRDHIYCGGCYYDIESMIEEEY